MDTSFPLFVRGLDGRTICLTVTPSQSIASVKATLQGVAGIPIEEQLLGHRHHLDDDASLWEHGISADAVISLTGRLRGGKGGFGSLLRGSGKGAVTENEDACRDLSGRRLRTVNAEKKLQEWAAGDKQRMNDKKDAKAERDRAKAEEREAAAQVDLDAVRKDQKAVLSRVALALESSIQAGNKRAGAPATQPQSKKPRYGSDSEEEDSDEEDTQAVKGAMAGVDGGPNSEVVKEAPVAELLWQPPSQAVT